MQATSRTLPICATVLATTSLGLAEFALRVVVAGPAHAGSLPLTLVALLVTWGALGLVAALAGRMLRPAWLDGPQTAPALAAAVLVCVRLAAATFEHWNPPLVRVAQLGGGVCAALVVCWVLCRLLPRAALLGHPAAWLAVSVLASAGAWAANRTPAHERTNTAPPGAASLLLVTIDTLRADRLGAYGHADARTPVIDGLAAAGLLFEDAVCHSVFTGPSHATILTGLLPVQHGLVENMQRLDSGVPTLADHLGSAGWSTGAFVSGFPVTQHASGLMQRFDTYDDDLRPYPLLSPRARETSLGQLFAHLARTRGIELDPDWRKAPEVTERALAWLDSETANDGSPFFGWVHYYDPHLPYEPPERLLDETARAFDGPPVGTWYHLPPEVQQAIIEDPAARAQMSALYDAEVALVDEQLGRLVETARARAGAGGLWIVITADHGESFGEHGIWWRRELYEPTLHVPLIVVPPAGSDAGLASQRISAQVRLIDLVPTVLEALNAPARTTGDGVSLLGLATGAESAAPGPAISMMFPTRAEPFQRTMVSVREDGWKAIWKAAGWMNTDARFTGELQELYELRTDAGELSNRASTDAARFEALHGLATEIDLTLRADGTLTGADLQRLRNLGYAE